MTTFRREIVENTQIYLEHTKRRISNFLHKMAMNGKEFKSEEVFSEKQTNRQKIEKVRKINVARTDRSVERKIKINRACDEIKEKESDGKQTIVDREKC